MHASPDYSSKTIPWDAPAGGTATTGSYGSLLQQGESWGEQHSTEAGHQLLRCTRCLLCCLPGYRWQHMLVESGNEFSKAKSLWETCC